MAFLCQYILNINCLWKFLSKIVLFIAYLGFLLSQTVSIPIFSSRTGFATLTPWYEMSGVLQWPPPAKGCVRLGWEVTGHIYNAMVNLLSLQITLILK